MDLVVTFESRGVQPDACVFEGVRPSEEIPAERDPILHCARNPTYLDLAERGRIRAAPNRVLVTLAGA